MANKSKAKQIAEELAIKADELENKIFEATNTAKISKNETIVNIGNTADEIEEKMEEIVENIGEKGKEIIKDTKKFECKILKFIKSIFNK